MRKIWYCTPTMSYSPNQFCVPLEPSAENHELVEDCDPALVGIVIAGLSAVAAGASLDALRMPLLQTDQDTIRDPYMVEADGFAERYRSQLKPPDYSLALDGIYLIAAARAASDLLGNPHAIHREHRYTGPTNHEFVERVAILPVPDKNVRSIAGLLQANYIHDVQVRNLSSAQEPDRQEVNFAACVGPEESIFANIVNLVARNFGCQEFNVYATAGSRRNDFGNSDSLGFWNLRNFARTANAALAAQSE